MIHFNTILAMKKLFSSPLLLLLTLLLSVHVISCEGDPPKGSGRSDATQVTLNKSTLALEVGATETLIATVEPSVAKNKSITWSSSSEDVATVSTSGQVTAIAKGTAVITATAHNGVKETVAVTVSNIDATEVSLNETTLTILIDNTATLTATVTPTNATNKNVTWTPSNTAIATVDENGKVTAKAAGTTTITASTHNGKTATCTVTVNKHTRYIDVWYTSGESNPSSGSESCSVRVDAGWAVSSKVVVTMIGGGGLGWFQMTIPAGESYAIQQFNVAGNDSIEIIEISPQSDNKYNYVAR